MTSTPTSGPGVPGGPYYLLVVFLSLRSIRCGDRQSFRGFKKPCRNVPTTSGALGTVNPPSVTLTFARDPKIQI